MTSNGQFSYPLPEGILKKLADDLSVAPFAESDDNRCSGEATGAMGKTRCTRKPKHMPHPCAPGYIRKEQTIPVEPVLMCTGCGCPRHHARDVKEDVFVLVPSHKGETVKIYKEMYRCTSCATVRQYGFRSRDEQ